MNVLIGDDHAIVREGIKSILIETDFVADIYEAVDGFEVIEKITKYNVDLLILDITMPGKNGIEVLKDVKKLRSKVKVLIISMHPEEQYAVRAMQAGASGYLTKDHATEELIDAVRIIASGRNYLTPDLSEELLAHLEQGSTEDPHDKLSDREFEVMKMLASGLSIKEISERLYLSEKTISTYRSRILEKMSMTRNAELTIYAFMHGMIDHPGK